MNEASISLGDRFGFFNFCHRTIRHNSFRDMLIRIHASSGNKVKIEIVPRFFFIWLAVFVSWSLLLGVRVVIQ
ncbi:MAG: hypothetical protein C5B59_10235 [Bacteroidetes bacterium]|nr:MAG: hypothetical protein C5B59_10235 [Bacteroidota bacterium]